MLLLVLWDKFTWGLGIQTFIGVDNWFYRVDNKSIQILAFVRALLNALEPYTACAASASGQSSRLNGFGLCHHDLAQVHVVTRAMKRAYRWVFNFCFIFVSFLFRGFRGLVRPFSLWRLCGLVAFTGLLVLFCFGDFLHPVSGTFPQLSLGACRNQQPSWGLGWQSQTLGWKVILPLLREWKLHQLKDLDVWWALSRPKGR